MESLDLFTMAYTALGGLGIFFLGLRFLSEGLQTISGEFIQKLINYATSNRIVAVIVGLTITTLVQSSSITTVMVVGLVNAGLMQLTQAIGVILGANIGTTITGWILVIKIGKYGLLLIGLGAFPMMFSRNERFAALGRTVLALGLIFLGLQLMSSAFKPLGSHEGFIEFLHVFDTATIFGLLGCVVIGCILTFIIQSSSAMLGITIALASTGTIDFPTAAALVLGENIGTTITALLASIGTNTQAVRAAVSHAVFNLLGVFIMLIIFQPYIAFIDNIVPGVPDFAAADGAKPYISAHIAMGHTMFNITATLLMLPFLRSFAGLIERLIPERSKQVHHLQYLGTPGLVATEVSLNMASLELKNMARITKKIMRRTRDFLGPDKPNTQLSDSVERLELVTDNIQKEMTTFICQVMQGNLTPDQSAEAYSLIRAADELESVADYCQSLCEFRIRLEKSKLDFSKEGWEDVLGYMDRTIKFVKSVIQLIGEPDVVSANEVYQVGSELTEYANQVRDAHLKRMAEGKCQALPALVFSDMIVAMRRIKNHTVNLLEAVEYSRNSQELEANL